MAENDIGEPWYGTYRARDISGELVVAEIKGFEVAQLAQSCRYSAGEEVPADSEKAKVF